jgi:hypothetical protein
MSQTICGVDDRILYVVACWAAISVGCRIYDAYNNWRLRVRLEYESARAVDLRTMADRMITK